MVALISSGHRNAPEAVYRAYAGYLAGVASRYLADQGDVSDVLHDSFLKIFGSMSGFQYRGTGSLKAWLTRIVVHESLKQLRRYSRSEPIDDLQLEIADAGADPPLEDVPPEALHEMIRALPPDYRTVLNLFIFERRSHREIAALLGIKESSSASRFHRAKAMLALNIRKYQSLHNR